MPRDNLRHAQYGVEGTQVDIPQQLFLPVAWDPNTRAMFAGNLSVPFPVVLANSVPNLTLNDTGAGAGTTATPFGITYTVRGGVLGPTDAIEIYSVIDWVGGNNKNAIIRVGPASGDWPSATAIGGQSGLSSQIYTPQAALIWNDGVTNQQRATPPNAVNPWNSSTSSRAVVLNINTALDWNIYIGVQFGLLNGGDTATLRKVIIRKVPT